MSNLLEKILSALEVFGGRTLWNRMSYKKAERIEKIVQEEILRTEIKLLNQQQENIEHQIQRLKDHKSSLAHRISKKTKQLNNNYSIIEDNPYN